MAAGRGGFALINRQKGVRLALPALREFLERIRKELGLAETELVICFVTDAEMARMNEAYRQKRGPTDVLSFPAEHTQMRNVRLLVRGGKISVRAKRSSADLAGTKARPLQRRASAEYLGDIAISPAVARRNAKKYGRGLPMELRILMLHGVLHLLGYDHETDHGEMDRLEAKLRRRFGLTWGI
jgi:probable rRNA maturation factor